MIVSEMNEADIMGFIRSRIYSISTWGQAVIEITQEWMGDRREYGADEYQRGYADGQMSAWERSDRDT